MLSSRLEVSERRQDSFHCVAMRPRVSRQADDATIFSGTFTTLSPSLPTDVQLISSCSPQAILTVPGSRGVPDHREHGFVSVTGQGVQSPSRRPPTEVRPDPDCRTWKSVCLTALNEKSNGFQVVPNNLSFKARLLTLTP